MSGTMYCFGYKEFTNNFKPQKIKMTNKVLRSKSVLFVGQMSQDF